jgi:branched-chain amino acid transport system permease protein
MEIIPQLAINSFIAASIYALLAMSFSLIFSTTKFFNFTHGSYPVIASYIAYYLIKDLGFNPYFSILIALAFTAVCAYGLDKIGFFTS